MEKIDDQQMESLLSKLGFLEKTPEETCAFLLQALRYYAQRIKENRDAKQGDQAESKNRNAFCSFCRKSYRDVGPLVEGPGDVYICGECIELCRSIVKQEQLRRNPVPQTPSGSPVI